jgi:hypothetical protein
MSWNSPSPPLFERGGFENSFFFESGEVGNSFFSKERTKNPFLGARGTHFTLPLLETVS